MELPGGIEKIVLQCIDFIYMLLPRRSPEPEILRSCKIVSHRGEHDNIGVYENTFAAFDRALAQGTWGIEFDVRWTRDLQPVVAHDPDLKTRRRRSESSAGWAPPPPPCSSTDSTRSSPTSVTAAHT